MSYQRSSTIGPSVIGPICDCSVNPDHCPPPCDRRSPRALAARRMNLARSALGATTLIAREGYSGLGGTPGNTRSYGGRVPRRRRPFTALGGAESCGPDQVWDPNKDMSAYGLPKGQCMPRGTPLTPAGSGIWDSIKSGVSSLLGALAPKPGTPATPTYQPPAQSGGMPSWAPIAAIGGIALVAGVLLTRK